jgi:hypothetical protein
MIPGLPSITAEAVALFRAREARRDPAVRIADDDIAVHLLPAPLRALARVGGRVGAVADRIVDGIDPFSFALRPEDAPAFLARRGYDVIDAADAAALATRYVKDGRVPAPGFHVVLARVRGERP